LLAVNIYFIFIYYRVKKGIVR